MEYHHMSGKLGLRALRVDRIKLFPDEGRRSLHAQVPGTSHNLCVALTGRGDQPSAVGVAYFPKLQ